MHQKWPLSNIFLEIVLCFNSNLTLSVFFVLRVFFQKLLNEAVFLVFTILIQCEKTGRTIRIRVVTLNAQSDEDFLL
jgi:hypothetical protein